MQDNTLYTEAGEFLSLPTITQTSIHGTTIFRPQNEKQVKLYNDTKDANLTSFYFSGTYGFLLTTSLLLIIITYLICWIFFYSKITVINKYYKYLLFIWIIILVYVLYQSNRLYNNYEELQKQVMKEIPNNLHIE